MKFFNTIKNRPNNEPEKVNVLGSIISSISIIVSKTRKEIKIKPEIKPRKSRVEN